MFRRSLFVTVCLLLAASAASANIILNVSVDTTSLAATHGAVDFNFLMGPVPPVSPASVDIQNFFTDGTLGTSSIIGDVAGVLPSTVTINNTTGLNDYFVDISFGNMLLFVLNFNVPAPNPFAQSGSAFSFSIFSDAAGTEPALTTDSENGYAFTVDLNPDGTYKLTNYSDQADVTIPEPGALSMAGAALAVLGAWKRRTRSAR